MTMGSIIDRIAPLFVPMLVFLATAGASISAADLDPKKSLRGRVDGYMQAVVDGNWGDAYPYLTSSYRNAVSEERFTHMPRTVQIRKYDIESIEIEPDGDNAQVDLSLEISFQGHTFANAPKIQQWVMEKGNWHLRGDANSPSPPPAPSTR